MEESVSGFELTVMILVRAGPLIALGLLVQFVLFRVFRIWRSALATLGGLATNVIVATAATLLACVLAPQLLRNALTMSFPSSLAFAPALIGVLVALTLVTSWGLRKRMARTS
jgi:hypothetical protein